MNTITLNKSNVKLIGRTYTAPDGVIWFSPSGSGFECIFKGKKLSLTLVGDYAAITPDDGENHTRYAVYIDGKREYDGLMHEAERTIELVNSGECVSSVIRFVKLSECAMSSIGVKIAECEGTIAPTGEDRLKIEFIGDSITCGYGIDDEVPEHSFSTATEDCTKAYAYKTAAALDADYSLFSMSGWGIISGYTEDDTRKTEQILPVYYKQVGYSRPMLYKGVSVQDIDWDFSRFVPDAVVINLGTNDYSYCKDNKERCELYREEYTRFLKVVHECNPGAKLFCVLGIMGDELYPYVKEAAQSFTAQTGYKDIYTLRLTPQDDSMGYTVSWHPTVRTHDRAAGELCRFMKERI